MRAHTRALCLSPATGAANIGGDLGRKRRRMRSPCMYLACAAIRGRGDYKEKKAGRIGGTREGRRREGGAMWKAKMKMECPPKPLL